MIQQDHLQIFDLTLNVWAPLFVGNGSSYTKKEYMYNTRNGKVSFLDEQKFFSFLVEHDLVDKYGQFMLSEQSNLWAFLSKDCGISDAELKTQIGFSPSATAAMRLLIRKLPASGRPSMKTHSAAAEIF